MVGLKKFIIVKYRSSQFAKSITKGRESLNNAAFHGSATAADSRMELRPGGALRVRVKDNGNGPSAGINYGLGSKLLDTVAMSWKLFRDGDATVLSADFTTELSTTPASQSG